MSTRRFFLTGVAAGGLLAGLSPSSLWGKRSLSKLLELSGNDFELTLDYFPVNFTGKQRFATTVSNSLPAPILRWKEGETVTLRVKNNLKVDSSIHWHGIILPTNMDGVPGLSFDGIKPGEVFEYQFQVNQSGTYWYHSHSGFQEQTGLYGAIIIDPKEKEPVEYDREHVVLLSDWSDEMPEDIYAKLKKLSHYYNFRERTVRDLWRDIKEKGVKGTWQERAMWNQMRMSDTDISDVTGYTYTFLMNGSTPEQDWTGIFKPGERVRLRIINAAAMTLFDFRIPGLKMEVISTDGQLIDPVSVDEFRIGVAETYDIIVEPEASKAYTIFAQAIDRSGFARGTLTPNLGLTAKVPEMDPPPVLGHRDMGMGHSLHDAHDAHEFHSENHQAKVKTKSSEVGMLTLEHDHVMDHESLGKAGFGSTRKITHQSTEFGPQVDMRVEEAHDGITDPGIGLREHQKRFGRRVLTYRDICNYYPTQDKREPSREIEVHLTGNMSRYMWSMNGVKFADAEPIILKYGERVRFVLVNDTMMTHPVHLHGMWSELETGDPDYIPRKHTIIVQPASKVSFLVTADAIGRWAFHCHLLYHMPGMFREVRVVK